VGAVTVDERGGRERAGGAASYAARVASAFGLRARVLTTCGDDADLAPLAAHEVCTLPAPRTLRFAHEADPAEAGGGRRLRLLERPGRRLDVSDLPAGWGDERALFLGPLLPDDLDVASFGSHPARHVALAGQGLQRRVGASGAITLRRSPAPTLLALLTALGGRATLVLAEGERAGWGAAGRAALAATGARLLVTQGARGAELHEPGAAPQTVAPCPARERDATGAGDVFAAAFILALAATLPGGAAEAAALAACFAASSVERAGPGPLPPRAEIERRSAQARGGAGGRSR
jgi:sugar/nucleoside kinase (ribokinase family)